MVIKWLSVYFLALLFPLVAQAGQDQVPRIAAASSLQFVLPEVLAEFKRQTGHSVRSTFGSSGNFRRQIIQGASFELFLSANESYIDALVERGLTVDSGVIYAQGRIALVAPKNSTWKLDGNLSGLRQALDRNEITKFAIANPNHAPFGRAAREALVKYDLWDTIQPYIVKGENASQATQFSVSGSTQGGIVPYALAVSPIIAESNRVVLIPQSSHQPITQRMVLLSSAGNVARQLYDFIKSDQARTILKQFGYESSSVSQLH
jgi:molybdate transport system substrate-binding protein|tara:strand:+ start:1523 stop:2311 length:789 start_codon:yes stop_codon:yes gene_type:complete